MGVRITLDITRSDAIMEAFRKLQSASDRQLEEVLIALFGDDHLYNYRIVSDYAYSNEYRRYDKLFGGLS